MGCAGVARIGREQYERSMARSRGQSAWALGAMGMVSFPCTDCGDQGCCGWGSVLVPPNGEGEIVLLSIEQRGVGRMEIRAFGGGAGV